MAKKPKQILELEEYWGIDIDRNKYDGFGNGEIVWLDMSGDQIYDFTPLKKLTWLNGLDLSRNQINDLAILKDVTQLTTLYLSRNLINNLAPLEGFSRLTWLQLSRNQISDINALKRLTGLNKLFLSLNRINDLTPLEGLTRLTMLDLSINQISDLESLKMLFRLTELDLSHNQIEYIAPLKALTHLTELYLTRNQISDLTALKELKQIIKLDLSSNSLTNLIPIEELTRLIELDLSSNKISNLMPLKGMTRLSDLNLSHNQISDITPLQDLTWCTKLNLAVNQISNLKPLEEFKSLIELDLSGNQISNINPLKESKYLTKLNLSQNLINNLDPLEKLTQLTWLDLSKNQVSDIMSLQGISTITQLNLSQNLISDLAPLERLTAITNLNLSQNLISDLTSLEGLSGLTELNLSDNQISDIKSLETLLDLKNLHIVHIDNNPITSHLPKEELQQGWSALKQYVKAQLDNSLVDINEVKVLFLGNTNIGKSTLLEYLETGEVNPVNPTLGIQYKRLTKVIPDTNIHVWDFGGQDYFHATHKLFFSPGALHVLMWSHKHEAREGEKSDQNYPLEYWLRCSEQLCHNKDFAIDILITENRMDEAYPQLAEQISIGTRYQNLKLHFTAINLMPQRRLKGFKELFKELIENLSIRKQSRPDYYKTYLDKINNAKLEGKEFLLLSDFGSQDKKKAKQIATTMEVFHLMGLLLYFPNIIPGKIFIEPKLLLDLLYESLLNKKAEQKKGKIEKADFEEAVKKHSLELNVNEVINLLQHFDLIFQIPDEEHWFAPQYLPEREQAWLDFISEYLFTFPNVRIDSDGYLMNVALLKLFTNYGKMVKRQPIKHSNDVEYLFWRDGLVIEKYGQVLMVKLDRAKQAMLLYGDKEGNNLQLQKEVISFIVGLAVKDRKEIEEMADKESDELHFEKIWDTNKFTITLAAQEGEYVPWQKLNQSKTSVVQHEGKTFLLKDFLQFLPRNKMAMKKIFISYSKDDLIMVNDFIKHLAALQVNGDVESWYCTELKAGEKWEETIQSHLDSADIICFMISPNFMKTKYIHQHEIPRAFERVAKSNPPAIVPIVLDFCDWKTTENNLQAFNALPYTLKPIADFANQNMAWYIVIEMLKQVIASPMVKTHEDLLNKIPEDVRRIYQRIIGGRVDA